MKKKKVKSNEILKMDWNWPYQRMSDGPEYSCRHGIGHSEGVHGCDGCCSDPNFPRRNGK